MTATAPSQDPLALAGFDPENAVAPVSVVEGPGVKLGPGTVLHPTVGLETGFISNVFYEQINPQAAGVLRVLGQVGVASLSQERLNPSAGGLNDDQHNANDKGDFQYDASARLAYDQMLSGNSTINNTGGLSAGLLVRGMVDPMGNTSLGFSEDFSRMIRAANFETSTDATRDINRAAVELLYHPAGRTVSGFAYYSNLIDMFESSSLSYPNRIGHTVGVHPMWRWLPQTLVYGDASLGFFSGLGSDPASTMKVSSMPLTVKAGIGTLLSLKTQARVEAGYTNGFYSAGPSWSAPTVDAMIGYRYSPLGRIAASYSLLYVDSVNANFYRDHVLRVILQQAHEPLTFVVQPELHFRQYDGLNLPGVAPGTVRDDMIFAIVGGIHYTFRNQFAATLDYHFSTVQTNFRYQDVGGMTIDPSFVRHELLLGVRAAL